ncbi:hypothetical protein BGZ83_001681 [Gryganskiella cystojenkinii]|nr:hypothetical protein BGZ83_001681 [Gryganskiella cystojenkinii]
MSTRALRSVTIVSNTKPGVRLHLRRASSSEINNKVMTSHHHHYTYSSSSGGSNSNNHVYAPGCYPSYTSSSPPTSYSSYPAYYPPSTSPTVHTISPQYRQQRKRGVVRECKICFEEFEWMSLEQLKKREQHPQSAPPSPPLSPQLLPDEEVTIDAGFVEADWGEEPIDVIEQIQRLQLLEQKHADNQPPWGNTTGAIDEEVALDYLLYSSSPEASSSSSPSDSSPLSMPSLSSCSSLNSLSSPNTISTSPNTLPQGTRTRKRSSFTKFFKPVSSRRSAEGTTTSSISYNNNSNSNNNKNGNGVYQNSGHPNSSIFDLPIFKYSAFRAERSATSRSSSTWSSQSASSSPGGRNHDLSTLHSSSPRPPSKSPDALKLGGALPCGSGEEDQEHLFCFECLSRHVATQVQARTWPVICPAENCRASVEDPFLIEMFLGGEAHLWHSTAMENAVQNKIYCPQKTCAKLIDGSGDLSAEQLREVNCPYCDYQFCASCSEKSHKGETCEFIKASKLTKESDSALENLAKQMKWKQCPSCKHMVEKISGCNHMTCRCSHQFCYVCAAKWSCSKHRG